MNHNISLSDFLKSVLKKIDEFPIDSSIISIFIEIPRIDLIDIYGDLLDDYSFSSFWEENNQISYLALGKCESSNYVGPNKFKFAKKFNNEIFKKLTNINIYSDRTFFPKLIYFFSFNDYKIQNSSYKSVPSFEAVLPKFLISKDNKSTYMSMNINLKNQKNIRELIKEFWLLRKRILSTKGFISINKSDRLNYDFFYDLLDKSKDDLFKKVSYGIKLVNNDILQKIVIGTRLIFKINNGFNLVRILKNLRINHPNSCKYVWKRNSNDINFGASPEKLFSFSKNLLTFEAVAGTAPSKNDKRVLLQSQKDLLEHNFVKEYLFDCLSEFKISNYKLEKLNVIEFGDVSHLYTEIKSNIECICPFKLLEYLHPSPAVCGIPKKEALYWINTIEIFDRGNYAAPIGWTDSKGNCDFRVAIRGARYTNNEMEITAGSGIVKGSIYKNEIEEITLKLLSLAKQFFS